MVPSTPTGESRASPTTVITAGGQPVAVRIRHVRFQVVEGPDSGAGTVMMRRELLVGTHPSNQIVLTDRSVSRFHFRVHAEDQGYRVFDPTSTNGTYVNGIRIRDGYLVDGAHIRAGHTVIAVTFESMETELELAKESSFGGAVGTSVPMREVFALGHRVARTDATVLILGETGTGKEVFARAIHDHGGRAGQAFVVLDCGATPATLIESILFGHVRGAFTGAEAAHVGVFERASGGTLFLDEIGELPLALQPKLLRVLETQQVMPVGGTREVPVDVRIIAATNRDLREMVEAGSFRSDLYYRLAVFPLELPPLRDRREDIPLLAGHFLRQLVVPTGHDPGWTSAHLEQAFAALAHHRWPGNVRELRNLVERAVATADPAELTKGALAQLVEVRASVSRALTSPRGIQEARAEFDRQYLRDLMAKTQGDLQRAGEIAGVHAKSIERLLRRYGLPRP